jgi:hypothetical protein
MLYRQDGSKFQAWASPNSSMLHINISNAPKSADRSAKSTLRCTESEWNQPKAVHTTNAIDPLLLANLLGYPRQLDFLRVA